MSTWRKIVPTKSTKFCTYQQNFSCLVVQFTGTLTLPLGLICRHQTLFAVLCGDASAPTGSGHYYMAQHPGLRCSRNVISSVLLRDERWSLGALYLAFRGFVVQLSILHFAIYYRRLHGSCDFIFSFRLLRVGRGVASNSISPKIVAFRIFS